MQNDNGRVYSIAMRSKTHRCNPSWSRLIDTNQSFRPQDSSFGVYASIEHVDTDDMLSVLVWVFAKDSASELMEVEADDLGGAPGDRHRISRMVFCFAAAATILTCSYVNQ